MTRTYATSAISSTSGGYQPASGTVNGSNTVFTFTKAPNAIVVDGVAMEKTTSSGFANWTGTTVITLTIAPTFDIFAIS